MDPISNKTTQRLIGDVLRHGRTAARLVLTQRARDKILRELDQIESSARDARAVIEGADHANS
jgi:hypothetical protein